MRYRSRISVILSAIIAAATLAPLLLDESDLTKTIVAVVLFMMIMSIFTTVNYTIADSNLIIKCLGTKMATINIAMIQSIKHTYNPLSSAAASLRRLEVKFYYNGRLSTILISPTREKEFLGNLKAINPDIYITATDKKNPLNPTNWDI